MKNPDGLKQCQLLYDLLACLECKVVTSSTVSNSSCDHVRCEACVLKLLGSKRSFKCNITDEDRGTCSKMFTRQNLSPETFFNDTFDQFLKALKHYGLKASDLDRTEPFLMNTSAVLQEKRKGSKDSQSETNDRPRKMSLDATESCNTKLDPKKFSNCKVSIPKKDLCSLKKDDGLSKQVRGKRKNSEQPSSDTDAKRTKVSSNSSSSSSSDTSSDDSDSD